MTRVVGEVVIIEAEKSDNCTTCGEKRELRPYGKNGARICFECGNKNREETERNMAARLNGGAS